MAALPDLGHAAALHTANVADLEPATMRACDTYVALWQLQWQLDSGRGDVLAAVAAVTTWQ